MSVRARLRGLLAAAALVCAAAAPAVADVEVRVDVGHGGRWVADCATVVNVTLRNTGAEAVGVTLALSQKESLSTGPIRHARIAYLGAGATRREPFVIPAPASYDGGLRIDVETEPSVPIVHAGRVASRGRMGIEVQATASVARTMISASGRVIGVVGDAASVLPSLLPNAERDEFRRAGTELGRVDALPVDERDLALAPFSLEGLDALVLIDPGAGLLADRAQLDAVLDWVALGGRLVVSPGEGSAALGATPLGPYLPGVTGTAVQGSARDVLRVLAAHHAEKVETEPDARPLALLPVEVQRGVPTVGPGLPLWADRPFGSGRVRLLAGDARELLRAGRDVGHLAAVATLLAGRASPLSDKEGLDTLQEFRWGAHVDVEESVGNVLRQDAFEPPPAIVIFGLLALYVLIVGPVDWLVLRRLGKQRLTTLTFGTAVLLFTVVAYAASFLVFSAGQVVNRIVLVDLQDAEREGRRLVRVHDLVAYYSPRGDDRTLEYPLPAAVLGSNLPGGGSVAEVGTAYPVLVAGSDPLVPSARVQVAFRSQRVARTLVAGVTGRAIETEWLPDENGERPRLRIVNGLPVRLDDCAVITREGGYAVGSLEPGGEAVVPWSPRVHALGDAWAGGGALERRPRERDVREFLGFLSRLSPAGMDGGPLETERPEPVALERQTVLTRTGVARGAALDRGAALLLAGAARCPLPLPADDEPGRMHVVIRKEIRLP